MNSSRLPIKHSGLYIQIYHYSLPNPTKLTVKDLEMRENCNLASNRGRGVREVKLLEKSTRNTDFRTWKLEALCRSLSWNMRTGWRITSPLYVAK